MCETPLNFTAQNKTPSNVFINFLPQLAHRHLREGEGNRPLSLHRAPDTTLPQHNNRNRPSEEPMTCRGATEGGEKSKCQHFLPVAKPPSFRSRRRCRIASSSSSSVDDSTATTLATCLGGRGVSVCWFLCWQCVSFLTLSLPLGRSMRSVAKKY